MSTPLPACPGSFRDSAGTVLDGGHCVYRAIDSSFSAQWEAALASGFFESASGRGLLIPFQEVSPQPGTWKTLESPKLPFISFPYEWCFGQLKDAALHTLDVLDEALAHGLILRDATAYNIQFSGWKPVFIDLLSFEPRDKGRPWQAYGQFCRFFLAPLALMARRSPLCGRFLRDWIDGLPLDLAASLLPFSTRFSPSLALHLHYHARLQARYADPREAARRLKKIRLSDKAHPNLSRALRMAVEGQKLPAHMSTEWGEYYDDTNYSPKAAESKMQKVMEVVAQLSGEAGLAVDIGANTARYSAFLAESFSQVLAVDIDYLAVEKLWEHVKRSRIPNLLPLVLDLCNPSPAIGWDNTERPSFRQRCKADYLSALAVIHHLVFTGGIPLPTLARGLSHLVRAGGTLVVEWVPFEDSQVQRLLSARSVISQPYSYELFLEAFAPWFELRAVTPIDESLRQLAVFRKKDDGNEG